MGSPRSRQTARQAWPPRSQQQAATAPCCCGHPLARSPSTTTGQSIVRDGQRDPTCLLAVSQLNESKRQHSQPRLRVGTALSPPPLVPVRGAASSCRCRGGAGHRANLQSLSLNLNSPPPARALPSRALLGLPGRSWMSIDRHRCVGSVVRSGWCGVSDTGKGQHGTNTEPVRDR